jgi:integrase
MYSKGTSQRASKGSVQIKSSNGRLQLTFSHGGKRHYLSLGIPDTKFNRKAAEAKAKLIESDMAYDRFDATLARYKPQSALSTVTPITPIQAKPSLAELWEKFIEYKRPQCSPNTMKYMYNVYSGYVAKLPTHELGEADKIRDYVLKHIPLDSGKRFITRLSACCDWAIKSGAVSENPFDGMAAEIKLPKSTQTEGLNDINPFTLEERDAIIEAIATNQFCPPKSGFKHSPYAPLVKFLFMTGCRPSEAVALQWKHISKDFKQISFEQAIIGTDSGRQIRQGLKTQERRKFPCNDGLRSLLQSGKSENASPDDLVFPSPKGKPINPDNFRNRIWKTVLKGLEIEYRKLYQTRHTFITYALDPEHGRLDAKDVARLVGNSPEVIYRHYVSINDLWGISY